MKQSQVLLQKEREGKANELLPPLMQGPIQLYIGMRELRKRAAAPQPTLSFAVRAHQAGFAMGLVYPLYRARRLAHVLPLSENGVHKSKLSHLSEKRGAGAVPRSGL